VVFSVGTLADVVDVAFECEVVGLCGATGENDFLGVCVDNLRYLLPVLLDGVPVVATLHVCNGVRVALTIEHLGHHRLSYPRVHRRGRHLIKVYWVSILKEWFLQFFIY